MNTTLADPVCKHRLHAWASVWGGAKRAFASLEIGTKNQKFLENRKSSAKFRLVGVILAMTDYLRRLPALLCLYC